MLKGKIAGILSTTVIAAMVVSGCGNGANDASTNNGAANSGTTNNGTVNSGTTDNGTASGNTSGNSKNGSNASSGDQGTSKTEEITVTATNFKFDKPEIHVKKGDKIKLTLVSKEGSHGLAIPDFNVDLKGNKSTTFTADKAGTFEFHCSVYCGTGHDNMTGKLIVE